MTVIRPYLIHLLKTLGRYKGEPTFIGGGACGQIFRVEPLDSNLPIAIKVQLNSAESSLEDIEREKAIAQKVRELLMEDFYSGTIPLYDSLQFSSEDELVFICLEMGVEDDPLEQEIESRIKCRRGFKYFELMKVCNEVCQCLLKMHANHLVHLDLKPGNVLYSKKIDKFIVIDFGISEDHAEEMKETNKNLDDFSAPSYGCSPAYASPLARKSNDSEDPCEHNPFKSDMFSLGLIMLELCAMQPNFSSLPLNTDKAVLTRALDIFLNFSGQHLFLEKEEEFHVVLELQAMLEWEEKDRPNIICVALNWNLPCLFSAFSLPQDLFNTRSDDGKRIKYFHDWELQFDEGDSSKDGRVTLKKNGDGRVVYEGGWTEGQPCGRSTYRLSELYYLEGEIKSLSYSQAEIKHSLGEHIPATSLKRTEFRTKQIKMLGKGFLLSERGFLQRSQFMKRDLTVALDVSDPKSPEETRLKIAHLLIRQMIKGFEGSAEQDIVLNVDTTAPSLFQDGSRKYELSLANRNGSQETKVSDIPDELVLIEPT